MFWGASVKRKRCCGMFHKLKTFFASDRKWLLIKEKMLAVIQHVRYAGRFGQFGKGSILYKPDRILGKKNIRIGNNVTILHHARMEVVTSHLEQKYDAHINIGDGVSIGQNFHVISAGDLTISEDTTISGNVFITNSDHQYTDMQTHVLRQEMDVGETRIGANCFIGFGAVILSGTVLGKNCVVGANAVVRGTFDDCCVIAGVPAKVVKKYNPETGKWEKVQRST